MANETTSLLPKRGGDDQREQQNKDLYRDYDSGTTVGHSCVSKWSGLALATLLLLMGLLLTCPHGGGSSALLAASATDATTEEQAHHEYNVEEVYQPYGLNDYSITNEAGEEVYYVKYQYHASNSYGIAFSFLDVANNNKELAVILGNQYDWVGYQIEREGHLWAEFTATYNETASWWDFSFKTKLWMDIVGQEDDYRIVAPNFWSWSQEQYTVERTSSGTQAGVITYSWSWAKQDMYNVVVEDGDDDVALLLISVVLDLIYHTDRDLSDDDDAS